MTRYTRWACTCGHIELNKPGTYNCAWHGELIIEENQ